MGSFAEPCYSKRNINGLSGTTCSVWEWVTTEGFSELADHFIQSLMPQIPSYTLDTSDFLDELYALSPIPRGSIVCTIDATALYPSKPYIDGLATLPPHSPGRKLFFGRNYRRYL